MKNEAHMCVILQASLSKKGSTSCSIVHPAPLLTNLWNGSVAAHILQALDKETDAHIRALLLSNRSAALANLSRFHNALQDADRSLRPLLLRICIYVNTYVCMVCVRMPVTDAVKVSSPPPSSYTHMCSYIWMYGMCVCVFMTQMQ